MSAPPINELLVDLADWPGIVVAVDGAGYVVASNGKLDALAGREIVGHLFTDLLDTESSRGKWERIVARRAENSTPRFELVLRGRAGLLDPRAFSLSRGGAVAESGFWLVEHPVDPRLVQLSSETEAINTELAIAQRALFKEQARLANALKAVERSNAALDEFAHAASHDLKAPLRAIADYAGLLAREAAPLLAEEHRGYVARLGVLATKMRGMIDAVLEFARSGRSSSTPQVLESRAVLDDVVAFLAPPPDVVVAIAPDLPRFAFRRVPFEQVFRNLLSNAIKHRRGDRARVNVSVSVSATNDNECWNFVVADDGPGIAESQQERIWRLFHTTRPGDGTGIGLAIVKRLVETEGGRVSVESSSGAGARFHVLWPKQPRDAAGGAAEATGE